MSVRTGDCSVQKRFEMIDPSHSRCLLEQVDVVLDHSFQAVRVLDQEEGEVKLRGPVLQVQAVADKVVKTRLTRYLLERKHDREEGMPSDGPLRSYLFQNLVDGEILMCVRLQQGLAHLRHDLPEGGVPGQ